MNSKVLRVRRLRAGEVRVLEVDSDLLRDNRIGDPSRRELPVYVPDAGERRLPVVFLLIGFTGTGREFLEDHPWKRGVVLEYDAECARGALPPAILAMPDAFTRYGGSQYVDSSLLGPYATHVARELTAAVDAHAPSLPGRRGVVGKSSGGVGALHLSMVHRGAFQAAASISGDAGFEGCHAPAFYEFARLFAARGTDASDAELKRFVDDLVERASRSELSGDAFGALNTIAMSACYSPQPDSALGFALPFDPRSGERIESVWRRWLEFDPIVACERHAAELRSLELLHLECGVRDEYNIQFGTRRLSRRLKELGVAHGHEEHEGSHRGIQHRYLPILARMAQRLQG